jgi:hypothetical protein
MKDEYGYPLSLFTLHSSLFTLPNCGIGEFY